MHLSSSLSKMNATKITIISFCVLLAGILLGFILMPMGLRKMIKSVRIERKYEKLLKIFRFHIKKKSSEIHSK